MTTTDKKIEKYLANIPNLHTFDGGKTWNTGGFHADTLFKFAQIIRERLRDNDLSIIETGAGNSTILFSLLQPRKLVSIAPDADLKARILEYCRNNEIDVSALDYRIAPSELALPKLLEEANEEPGCNVFLIDGNHGWPTVFVDFCYGNYLLRKGGLMLIDDIQLHSVKELVRFLHEQPDYELVENLHKVWVWKKVSEVKLMPGHNFQPYIKRKTQEAADAMCQWEL